MIDEAMFDEIKGLCPVLKFLKEGGALDGPATAERLCVDEACTFYRRAVVRRRTITECLVFNAMFAITACSAANDRRIPGSLGRKALM